MTNKSSQPGSGARARRSNLSSEAFWMPFTPNRAFHKDPRVFVAADNCHYITHDGRRVFDSLSGLWCTGYGHNRPEISAAVTKQLNTMDYAPGFQFAHPLAVELADRLTAITPGDLNHVFYTNSGSDCADTSLKLARAYWRMRGKPSKTKFIGRAKGYHGVNFAGTSVGGIGPNRKLFGELHDAEHLPHTLRSEDAFTRGQPQGGEELADYLEHIVALHDASNIAAVIVEPVSGSAGVLVPPTGYLKRLRELCTKHEILLIFDEVITGFARTGERFGADTFDVIPDIMNLAKALTNGAIPMGAVVVDRAIYDAFMEFDQPEHMIELPHGYTYSAHPVGCAAALACLDILEQDDIVDRSKSLAKTLENTLHGLRGKKHVTDIRNFGLTGALQIEPRDGDPVIRPYEIGIKCYELGVYVRWGGDTLQFAPPFVSEASDIERMGQIVSDAIDAVA